MEYNICCQHFDRVSYVCNSSKRKKFMGMFKRTCVCVPALFTECKLKLEYSDRPPLPFLPHKKERNNAN